VRLYLRHEIDVLLGLIKALQSALLDLAEPHINTIMPGFTHLQVAQPISFAHHLMAYFEMLKRDAERLHDCRKRINRLPLGAAALAGTSYPIKREYVADLLGFDGVCENSLDAVSDRDFAIEFTACAALIMTHLSRFSEELILWMNPRFGFIDIADRFCTGSSIMPQKKNPDVPELVRGKTGRVNGHLVALLTLMKGQPLAYNKDNQEDKEPLFDTVENADADFAHLRRHDHRHHGKAGSHAQRGFAGLCHGDGPGRLPGQKGLAVPRCARSRCAGRALRRAARLRIWATSASPSCGNSQRTSAKMCSQVLSLEGSLASRNHIGGTAPNQVAAAIVRARSNLAK